MKNVKHVTTFCKWLDLFSRFREKKDRKFTELEQLDIISQLQKLQKFLHENKKLLKLFAFPLAIFQKSKLKKDIQRQMKTIKKFCYTFICHQNQVVTKEFDDKFFKSRAARDNLKTLVILGQKRKILRNFSDIIRIKTKTNRAEISKILYKISKKIKIKNESMFQQLKLLLTNCKLKKDKRLRKLLTSLDSTKGLLQDSLLSMCPICNRFKDVKYFKRKHRQRCCGYNHEEDEYIFNSEWELSKIVIKKKMIKKEKNILNSAMKISPKKILIKHEKNNNYFQQPQHEIQKDLIVKGEDFQISINKENVEEQNEQMKTKEKERINLKLLEEEGKTLEQMIIAKPVQEDLLIPILQNQQIKQKQLKSKKILNPLKENDENVENEKQNKLLDNNVNKVPCLQNKIFEKILEHLKKQKQKGEQQNFEDLDNLEEEIEVPTEEEIKTMKMKKKKDKEIELEEKINNLEKMSQTKRVTINDDSNQSYDLCDFVQDYELKPKNKNIIQKRLMRQWNQECECDYMIFKKHHIFVLFCTDEDEINDDGTVKRQKLIHLPEQVKRFEQRVKNSDCIIYKVYDMTKKYLSNNKTIIDLKKELIHFIGLPLPPGLLEKTIIITGHACDVGAWYLCGQTEEELYADELFVLFSQKMRSIKLNLVQFTCGSNQMMLDLQASGELPNFMYICAPRNFLFLSNDIISGR